MRLPSQSPNSQILKFLQFFKSSLQFFFNCSSASLVFSNGFCYMCARNLGHALVFYTFPSRCQPVSLPPTLYMRKCLCSYGFLYLWIECSQIAGPLVTTDCWMAWKQNQRPPAPTRMENNPTCQISKHSRKSWVTTFAPKQSTTNTIQKTINKNYDLVRTVTLIHQLKKNTITEKASLNTMKFTMLDRSNTGPIQWWCNQVR